MFSVPMWANIILSTKIYAKFSSIRGLDFKSALKKIKQMSLEANAGLGDDVDEEEMLHALEADWSQSWKRLDLRPNTKLYILIPTGKS